MDLTSNFKCLIFKSFLAVLFCSILLWFSVFLYGLLYYSYIPAIAHFLPIYLRFDPTCTKSRDCEFPSANLTLVKKDHRELLTRGQAYAVEVALDMPESEANFNQGMFMIKIDMLSQNGRIVQSSLRPAMLHYKSSLFKVIYTFFYTPGLLAGTVEEKQHIVVSLFDQYEEDQFIATHFVYVEIQARNIEVYSSNLRIHARFTGLRYFMYYWPITATVLFVGTNFFFLSVIFAFIWFRQILNESSYESQESMSWREQERLTQEIRKTVRRKQEVLEHKPLSSDEQDATFEDLQRFNEETHPRVEELSPHKPYLFQSADSSSGETVEDENLTSILRKRASTLQYESQQNHPVFT